MIRRLIRGGLGLSHAVWPAGTRPFLFEAALVAFALLAGESAASSDPDDCAVAVESMFHREPRWLGGDAVYSVVLGDDRRLWLFGDSFVATSNARNRRESVMVSNTVALQVGADPARASMSFHWQRDAVGAPSAFFADADEGIRHWPGHGIRVEGGPLVLFLNRVRNTPGVGLGFEHAGYTVALVDDPDAAVETWRPKLHPGPATAFDAVPGAALVREFEHIVSLAIRQQGMHAGALVRYRLRDLAAGELGDAEWWTGDVGGWVTTEALGENGPAWIIDDAGAESSVHWDAQMGRYVHVASYGFGASSIGLRTAPSLTGPWSAPRMVYRPPESDSVRPMVYAGKAHPQLCASNRGDLVVTYATNSFEFSDLFLDEGSRALYWPRVARLRLDVGTEPDSAQ